MRLDLISLDSGDLTVGMLYAIDSGTLAYSTTVHRCFAVPERLWIVSRAFNLVSALAAPVELNESTSMKLVVVSGYASSRHTGTGRLPLVSFQKDRLLADLFVHLFRAGQFQKVGSS